MPPAPTGKGGYAGGDPQQHLPANTHPQSLYAAGAALCFISTWVSIGIIVLVQLNYALAPGMWRGRKQRRSN